MKSVVYILTIVSCFMLTSCFTVIETTSTDYNEYYYSEPTTVIVVPPPDIYINYPAPKPVEQKKEIYKERKIERPSNGTIIRHNGGQRSSNKNGNVNRGNTRNSENVKQKSKSQRR